MVSFSEGTVSMICGPDQRANVSIQEEPDPSLPIDPAQISVAKFKEQICELNFGDKTNTPTP